MDDQGRRASGTLARRLCLAVAACAALALCVAPAALATTFTVNSTGDQVDQMPNNNDCDIDGADTCTLRAAIQETEDAGSSGSDVISFNLAPASTIQLTAVLPGIGQQLSINGCSGALNNAGPCVGLRGLDTSTDAFGTIQGPSVTIRGLAITNVSRAIPGLVGSTGLTVKNNWFGIQIDGDDETIQQGVQVTDDGAVIGGPAGATGTTPADRNVFANATVATGVGLDINVGDGAVVQGNWFGTDETGAAAKANDEDISLGGNVGETPTGTIIGGAQTSPGTCAGACNVISGASTNGINLQSTAPQPADTTSITGNFIGLNAAGTAAIPNNVGIRTVNAPDTTIGGPAAGDRNYISGGTGVAAAAQGAPGLEVRNNFIGISPSGNAALGAATSGGIFVASKASSPAIVSGNRIAATSLAYGMSVSNADPVTTTGPTISGNIIGLGTGNQDLGGGDVGIRAPNLTDATITGNTLTNNSFAGITLENADDNVITGNRFNTDPNGGGDHSGTGAGILIDDNPTAATGNTIGGDTAASENLFSNVANGPIVVRLGDNDNNTFGRNRGTNNFGPFIDLGQDGPGNDNVDAPNAGIDAPTITSAADDFVAGSGAAANATVLVFETPDAGDPSDVNSFVGQATASAAGAWQLPVNLPNGTRVTALQTDASGDSSELAASKATVADPPETTITSGPKKRSRLKRGKKRKRITFTFVSSEPEEGGFQCQIDSKPFVLCSSPFVRRLKKGRHTFRVRAFDAASNADPTLAIRKFRIVPRRHR